MNIRLQGLLLTSREEWSSDFHKDFHRLPAAGKG